MSGVKRWGTPDWREWNKPNDRGMYVLYADHVAAVAEAEQRVLFDVQHRTFQHAWNAGVTAARDAVEALNSWNDSWLIADVRAAIDALKEERE